MKKLHWNTITTIFLLPFWHQKNVILTVLLHSKCFKECCIESLNLKVWQPWAFLFWIRVSSSRNFLAILWGKQLPKWFWWWFYWCHESESSDSEARSSLEAISADLGLQSEVEDGDVWTEVHPPKGDINNTINRHLLWFGPVPKAALHQPLGPLICYKGCRHTEDTQFIKLRYITAFHNTLYKFHS